MKINNVEILVARPEDAEEILALQKQCFEDQAQIYNDYRLPPLLQTLAEVEVDMQDHLYLKAVWGNRIIGSVRGKQIEDTAHISRLIVHPEWQNNGVGTRLMLRIEAKYLKVGYYELFTGWKSKKNIHVYEKLGYEVFGDGAYQNDVKILNMRKRSPIFSQK